MYGDGDLHTLKTAISDPNALFFLFADSCAAKPETQSGAQTPGKVL